MDNRCSCAVEWGGAEPEFRKLLAVLVAAFLVAVIGFDVLDRGLTNPIQSSRAAVRNGPGRDCGGSVGLFFQLINFGTHE
jgi:hypothetical protein